MNGTLSTILGTTFMAHVAHKSRCIAFLMPESVMVKSMKYIRDYEQLCLSYILKHKSER